MVEVVAVVEAREVTEEQVDLEAVLRLESSFGIHSVNLTKSFE